VYYAIFTAIGIGTAFLILGGRSGGWEPYIRAGGAALLGALPSVFVLIPYLRVKAAFGGRGLYEAYYFAATGLSYLSFSSFNSLMGSTSGWTHSEATLCPGYLALATCLAWAALKGGGERKTRIILVLLVVATAIASTGIGSVPSLRLATACCAWFLLAATAFLAYRRPTQWAAVAALGILAFVFSLGPLGNPDKGQLALAPYALAHLVVPGMDSVRAVARFGSIVVLVVYLAAFHAVSARHTAAGIGRAVLPLALLLGTLAENYTGVVPIDALAKRPEVFDVLGRTIKPGEAAIVLPFARELKGTQITSWTDFATLNSRYALWAAESGVTIVNGYSGQRSKLMNELPRVLESFPSRAAVDRLSHICGMSYVIILRSMLPTWNEESDKELAALRNRVNVVYTSQSGDLMLQIIGETPLSDSSVPWMAPPGKSLVLSAVNESGERCTVNVEQVVQAPPNRVTVPLFRMDVPPGRGDFGFVTQKPWAGSPAVLSIRSTSPQSAVNCSALAD
jgi:hypothetical protein